jgi:hypothetical protein
MELKDFSKSNSMTLTNEYVILIVGLLPIILIIFMVLYLKLSFIQKSGGSTTPT